MALPKGFGSGGSGGAGRADVEAMIGRRVENMVGIITLSRSEEHTSELQSQ